MYHKSTLNSVTLPLGVCVSVCTSVAVSQRARGYTLTQPPLVMAFDVFLITLKNDGARLYPSVSPSTPPAAAETYITLIGSNSSNICHHVAFMDQQCRLLKINTGTACWDRGVLRSISGPMTLVFQR